MTVYTPSERVEIIKWFYGGNSAVQCRDLFSIAFENRPIPCEKTILNVVSNFETSFCLQDCHKCHSKAQEPPIERVQEKERLEEMVCSALEVDPTRSSRSVGEELGMDHKTVTSIWKKHGFKCYKYSKTQEIFPEDQWRRMEFCETMMEKSNENENFLQNILFSDESSFPLHGKHNPSIVRYWSRENEHRSFQLRTQYPQKLNVWAGILGDHIIGPFFIDGTLNAAKYLELLQNQVLPAIQVLPNLDLGVVYFQQDGCPAHNAVTVKEFLTNTFPNRLISGTGDIKWPPRSPDLSPNDFFLWGYLKETIYKHQFNRPTNLEQLREKIVECGNSISPETLAEVRNSFYNRLTYCLAKEGGLFEPFL